MHDTRLIVGKLSKQIAAAYQHVDWQYLQREGKLCTIAIAYDAGADMWSWSVSTVSERIEHETQDLWWAYEHVWQSCTTGNLTTQLVTELLDHLKTWRYAS